MTNQTLTDADFQRAATLLGCEIATIKAAANVESRGIGFLVTGEPKVLFEAHIFDGLTGGKYRRSHPNISSARWNKELYGPAGLHQHKRLQQAILLDRNAALQSASWGKFQVMGFNWALVGRKSLQDFVNAQYRNEGEHLKDFVGYVIARGLKDELQQRDWAGFALGYNGEGYKENQYDTKMAAAYKQFSRG